MVGSGTETSRGELMLMFTVAPPILVYVKTGWRLPVSTTDVIMAFAPPVAKGFPSSEWKSMTCEPAAALTR